MKFYGGQNSSFDASLDRPGHSSAHWGQREKLLAVNTLAWTGKKAKHKKQCRHASLLIFALWYDSDFLDNYHYRATYDTVTGHI